MPDHLFTMEKRKKSKHFLHQPEFSGGPKAMTEFIYKNLRYPKAAAAANIEGLVVVEIGINHKGAVTEAKVLKSLGHGCDEEAVRVCKLLSFTVEKNHGVQVGFHKKIRIQFKKPKPKQQSLKMQYSVKPKEQKPQEPSQQQNQGGGYSYTISFPTKK